jgi:Fe2+ or Zn2+ uptake regulation protein
VNARHPDLPTLLRERGMRVTSQRLLIDEALRRQGGHRSAEQVHEAVASALPGVSHQTVYATLQLLADLGVARRVPTAKGSTRFETRLDEHHHMACEQCGQIVDLDVHVPVQEALAAARAGGFQPGFAALTVMGRCPRCASTQSA